MVYNTVFLSPMFDSCFFKWL